MARGDSGRIVIEVDPNLKDRLYVELARQRLTLKAWFIGAAEEFQQSGRLPGLSPEGSPPAPNPAPASKPSKLDLSESS